MTYTNAAQNPIVERWVIEIDSTWSGPDTIYYVEKACRQISSAAPAIRFALHRERAGVEGRVVRHLLGLAGEYPREGRGEVLLPVPPPAPVSGEQFLLDIATIPGHPPIYQPDGGQEILPEHCVHDIRQCGWCVGHPMART